MSTLSLAEEEKYQKKYLKYKEKYFLLQKQLEEEELKGGGSTFKTFKSGLKQVAANPAFKQAASAAASAAMASASQDPLVQAKLAKMQQAYGNSATAQLATQIALSNPSVQSALSSPKVQSALSSPKVQSAMNSPLVKQAMSGTPAPVANAGLPAPVANSQRNPDDVWKTLTLEQKKQLISML